MDISLEDIFIPNVATILTDNINTTNEMMYSVAITYLIQCCNELTPNMCDPKMGEYINSAQILHKIGFIAFPVNKWLWERAQIIDRHRHLSIVIFADCTKHLMACRKIN
jgi:hypothetical protein